ncbi:ADP,ATP carrier protein [Hondaea fermentalgiana]|uniref:ADP/ATP translocase n=1 Tax=Hondaea fermentalgiana TaxID=2315210 RepID=A0A2R5GXI7_9STRA|nr:ADP,ATP carrier protein [Hondaea fermentalgiana]|eukprot:GBG33413.1 ADP,ATP carrier protein [Hondaea fermentalgiana]
MAALNLTQLAMGGLSDALVKSLVAPIDRVKLVLQTQDVNPEIKSGTVTRYANLSDAFSRIYNEQGLAAFWAGNSVTFLTSILTPVVGALLSSPSVTRFINETPLASISVGTVISLASLVIIYPLDFAHTRLASDVSKGKKQFEDIADCMSKTTRGPHGVLSLYNGVGGAVAGMFVFSSAYVAFAEALAASGFAPSQGQQTNADAAALFFGSQLCSLGATLVSYPFDTVRCRMQMEAEKSESEAAYNNSLHCFSTIFNKEGVAGLFKGAGAQALRTVAQAAALVLVGGILQSTGVLA